MEEDINIKNKIQVEVDKLIVNEWIFLDEDWPKIQNKYNHRTELKDINEIDIIKKELINKLGYISVFFFLNVLYTNQEYPGPHREIEKGLILLYHLVCGKPGSEMGRYMKYTTFYKLYSKFWIDEDNYRRLYKKVNNCLNKMFSTPLLRLYTSIKNNPEIFKHVTLVIDGHDSRINYVNTDIKKEKLYSYKLKTSGVRTQIISDMNDMILWVSKSEYCSESSDGNMMVNMKLYNKLSKSDCMACDGGYTLFIKKLEELCEQKGSDLCDDNFLYPIRKELNKDLTKTEAHFNQVFGSFRSTIENQFSVIGSKFGRFNNNNKAIKMQNIKYYNLQFRVSCLLKNISVFCEKFNIIVQPHHRLWELSHFDFPVEKTLMNIVITNELLTKEKTNKIKNIQKEFMNLQINSMDYEKEIDNYSDDEIIENITSEDDVPEEYNNKRKRRNKSNRKVTDINKLREIKINHPEIIIKQNI